MIFLAQTAPPAAALASFLEVVFYLIGIVCAGAVLYRQFRPGEGVPQPLTVRKHDEGVTDDELRQVHGRIARERTEIDAKISALAAEDIRLRERLDGDISNLNERIDELPARVIKLLRETKGLL